MGGKRRTPEQIIADMEEKLDRARAKKAMSDAEENPALAPLVARISQMKEAQKSGKLGLGDGPQSYAERIRRKQLWIEYYEAMEAYDRAVAEVSIEPLESFLSDQVQAFTNGTDIESIQTNVSEFLEKYDDDDEALNDLRLAVINTGQARREATESAKSNEENE